MSTNKDVRRRQDDGNALRRLRSALSVTLRKSKREDASEKRRNAASSTASAAASVAEEEEVEEEPPFPFFDLRKILQDARDFTDPERQRRGVHEARKVFASDSILAKNKLQEEGIVETLVGCLKTTDKPRLQYEAVCALINFTSDKKNRLYRHVLNANVFPVLEKLLWGSEVKVCEQVLTLLGNIVAYSKEFRDKAVKDGLLEPLLALAWTSPTISILQDVAWVISHFCLNIEPGPIPQFIELILPILNKNIQHSDMIIVVHTLYAIGYLTEKGCDQVKMIVDCDYVPRIISILAHKEQEAQLAALIVIRNITATSDETAQIALDEHVLSQMPGFLKHPSQEIRREAIGLMENVFAGNENQVKTVIDANLLPLLIDNMREGEDRTRKDVVWAILNLSWSADICHLAALINAGVIEPLCGLLASDDTNVIISILEVLRVFLASESCHNQNVFNLIEECDGWERLESLQNHDNVDIYNKVNMILERYLHGEESLDLDMEEFEFDPENPSLGPGNAFMF